jgi:phenylpropionate dioxygenase-like ring-hydroxylating dioxygenase large terminal subunit
MVNAMSQVLPERFFIRNAWTVVAWPHEVNATRPLARTVMGDDLVLFRTANGEAVALEDRCAHRLAPLSRGRVEADGIRCLYHGVKFSAGGRCIEVPAQNEPNALMCVRRYPLVEQDGFVWIWMGDADRADPALIVPAPWHDSPHWAPSRGYLHVKAHQALIMDNLTDFGHLPFVHQNTVGAAGQEAFATEVTPRPRGLRTDRWYLDVPASRFHQLVGQFTGHVDAWHCYDWHLPAIMSMESGSAPTGTGARSQPHGQRAGAIEFHHIAVLTPQDEDHTHYFWVHWRNFALDDRNMDQTVYDNIMAAFAEDKAMVEAQHQAIRRGSHTQPRGIAADKALNILRLQIAREADPT